MNNLFKFLMLILMFAVPAKSSCVCSSGFTPMDDGVRCASLILARVGYNSSEESCRLIGRKDGHLISVRNAQDVQFVQNLSTGNDFWVGADNRQSATYSWTDGYSPVEQTLFPTVTSWTNPGTCLGYNNNNNWATRPCGDDLSFVCEETCTTSTTTAPGTGTGENDPHFTTFDGLKNDSQTTCPYILSQPCKKEEYKAPFWSITAKNTLLPHRSASMVTFIQLAIGGNTYSAEQDGKKSPIIFKYNGAVRPIPFDDGNVKAQITAGQIVIETNSSIIINFSYAKQRVTVPGTFNHGTGILCGLLGDFDGDCSNDLVGRDGKLYAKPKTSDCKIPVSGPEAMKAEEFADTWITERKDNCLLGAELKKGGPLPVRHE